MNKLVRYTDGGIELEADPRHAEIVVKDLGFGSVVPGTLLSLAFCKPKVLHADLGMSGVGFQPDAVVGVGFVQEFHLVQSVFPCSKHVYLDLILVF